jgi:hypothetical protein
MTSTVESPSATALLGIPQRVPSDQTPFWHRPVPLVAVTHVDPDHARLRSCFPTSWEHLVRAKTILDGTAVLDNPRIIPPAVYEQRIAPLLSAAAYEFIQLAGAEEASGRREVAEQARVTAHRLLGFANTGEWEPITLRQPRPGQPWLYCGPLNTWAVHTRSMPLGLLVVRMRDDLQGEPDAVDANLGSVKAAVELVLGGPARSTMTEQPTMQIADLLLAGGESSIGHKNFAHFFPLEAPGSSVDGPEFTIVFANIHDERLRRASLPLLAGFLGKPLDGFEHDVLGDSLRWFRCHDLAHFWCRVSVEGEGRSPESLPHFERMTLEETYADLIGLISAASVVPTERLGRAFAAELLRYLSREYPNFADSAAAVLTVGWLRERTGVVRIHSGDWLSEALPVLSELAAIIHDVLREGSLVGLDAISAALRSGAEFREGLTGLFQSVPTDLDYTFG